MMKRLIYVLFLVVMLTLTLNVFAQDDERIELPQSYTSEDAILSFNYPEGWVAQLGNGNPFLLSGESLLQPGAGVPEGEVILTFLPEATVGEFNFDETITVTRALEVFALVALGGEGEAFVYESLDYPAAFAPVSGESITVETTLFALRLEAGFVFVLARHGGPLEDFEATLIPIFNSVVYDPEAPGRGFELGEDRIYTSFTGTTTVTVPAGWRIIESEGNFLIGSTGDALLAREEQLTTVGDLQMIISSPELMTNIGMSTDIEAEEALVTFLRILAREDLQPEPYDGLDVPAFWVSVEDVIPVGPGYLMTFTKDGGTFFVSAAFVGEFEDYEPLIVQTLNSLTYDPDAEPPAEATPEAEATEEGNGE